MVCFRYPKCYYRSRISLVIIMKWWALRHTHTAPQQTVTQEGSRALSHVSQQPGELHTLSSISTNKDLRCFFPGGKGGGEQHKGIKRGGSLIFPFFYQSLIICKYYLEILTPSQPRSNCSGGLCQQHLGLPSIFLVCVCFSSPPPATPNFS